MTINLFFQLPLAGTDFFSKSYSEENSMAGRKMRERVGKKQLRLLTRSLRSLACNRLHFGEKSARMSELEKTLRVIILLFMLS